MIEHQQDSAQQERPSSPVSLEGMPVLKVPETGTGAVSAVANEPLQPFHGDFAEFHEGYVRHYISLADTKAAWAFTVATGALAFVFGRTASKTVLLHPQWSVETALIGAAISFLCLSALFSFLVIRPRRTSSSPDGVIFFTGVATKPNAKAYILEIAKYDQAALTGARLEHCYDISRVCTSKYSALRLAIWSGLLGIVFALSQLLWV